MTPDPAQTVWGFPATSWSLVRRAGGAEKTGAGAALEALCHAYWRPLYAYARGRGLSRADAQDAVQDFFATALRRELFGRADEAAGKLRNFLLTALKHHLQDRAAREGAARRRPEGGWADVDFAVAEAEWARSGAAATGPDAAYEKQWARELLSRALARTEARYAAEGKPELFAALRGEALDEAPTADARTLAGLSDGARRVAVHRLRKRFAEALRAVVAETLPPDGDIDAELRELGATLREDRR